MTHAATYELVGGERHRHQGVEHAHPHTGPHEHGGHAHQHRHHGYAHGHSHGLASACVAGYEAIDRLLDPRPVHQLGALAAAGAIGFAGNRLAAIVRTRAGRRLDSPALLADGDHARADAYVSLAVIVSALAVALGLPVVDPLIGLAITLAILRITWTRGGRSAMATTSTRTGARVPS